MLSGLIIRQSGLKAGRRYGVALTCESLLLIAATHFLRHGSVMADYLATMACGLQNAMATSYSGAVIRSTHMTGMITDLGIALGLAARRESVDWRPMRLYAVLLTGFFVGGVLGGYRFSHLGTDCLVIPAAITGVTGVVYTILKHRTPHRLAHPPDRRAPKLKNRRRWRWLSRRPAWPRRQCRARWPAGGRRHKPSTPPAHP